MKSFKEEDMYKYVQKYFKGLGYEVHGEVSNCDVVCIKNDEIIIIEMKKNFSTKLLAQALSRQKITEKVYIAIPKPKKYTWKKRIEILGICKRLGVGVILINMVSNKDRLNIALEPIKMSIVLKRKREKVLNELNNRNVNINKGGITNKKINTAFKEKCVKIACALELVGESSAKDLIKFYECDVKTNNILYVNILGWFDKVSRGVYRLNDYGLQKIHSDEFKEVYDYYKKDINCIYNKIELGDSI